MGRVETGNAGGMQVEHGIDATATQSGTKPDRASGARPTLGAGAPGAAMSDLMAMRRPSAVKPSAEAAHTQPAHQAHHVHQVQPEHAAPLQGTQKPEGRRAALRRGLSNALPALANALPAMAANAMPMMQMVVQMEDNQRQLMQQTTTEAAQFSNNVAESLEKSAR